MGQTMNWIDTGAKDSINGIKFQYLRVMDRLIQSYIKNEKVFVTTEFFDDVFQYDNHSGTTVLEQDKYMKNSLSLDSVAVKKSVQIFLDNWLKMDKSQSVSFVFYSNARRSKENKKPFSDILKRNSSLSFPNTSMIQLLAKGDWNKVKPFFIPTFKEYYMNRHNNESVWAERFELINDCDWIQFFKQVEWHFEEPNISDIKNKLKSDINEVCKNRNISLGLCDYIFAKLQNEILERENYSDFIDCLVSTDYIEASILKLAQYKQKNILFSEDKWFEKRLQRSIANMGQKYSEDLDITVSEESIMEQMTVNTSGTPTAIMIYGQAGIGKSHFMAHCARNYLNNGGKCVLILSNFVFYSTTIGKAILDTLDISSEHTFEEFLDALNSWGEALKKRSLIFLDAINEEDTIFEQMNGLIKTISEYPWLGLVFSVRNTALCYLESMNSLNVKKVELKGFANSKNAIESFFEYYKIPLEPIDRLRYEFKIPLFLKIYCESYSDQRMSAKTDFESIVTNYFININNRISSRIKYHGKINLLLHVLNIYADCVLWNNDNPILYDHLQEQIVLRLTKYDIPRNYLDEVINEAIFTCISDKEGNIYINFEYEIFEDFIIVNRIITLSEIEKYRLKKQTDDFFTSANPYDKSLRSESRKEMLAILLPDKNCLYCYDGFEMYNWPSSKYPSDEVMRFCNSLLWRKPEKIHMSSYSLILNNLQNYDNDAFYEYWETILKISTKKNHPYNAEYLVDRLSKFKPCVLDRFWTCYISDKFFDSDVFNALTNMGMKQKEYLDKEQINLLGITFGCFLGSLDYHVLNQSMQVIYHLYIDNIVDFTSILRKLFNINDWSIRQRLMQILLSIVNNCMEEQYEIVFNCLDSIRFFLNEDYYIFQYANAIVDFITLHKSAKECIDFAEMFSECLQDIPNQSILKFIRKENCITDEPTAHGPIDSFIIDMLSCCDDENDLEIYYTLQNNIVYSLMSLYTKIEVNYDNYDFITSYAIEDILPEYREMFCKNVIVKIFELGYSYFHLGFWDLYFDTRYYPSLSSFITKYEKEAFSAVLMLYYNTLQRDGVKVMNYLFSKLQDQFCFIDLTLTNSDKPDCIQNSTQYIDQIITIMDNEKWIRVDSSSGITVNLLECDKSIAIDDNNYVPCLEGVFYSELFITKRFYEAYDYLKLKDRFKYISIDYLWDYDPFFEFSILDVDIYQEMKLTISDDKFHYYHEGIEVCKNTIYEDGKDSLLIKKSFLDNFLHDKKCKLIWIYSTKTNKQIKAYNGVKFITIVST